MAVLAIRDAPAAPSGPVQGYPGSQGPPHSRQTPPILRDPRPTTHDPPLTEALLTQLWAGQRFPASALVTRQGVPLRVLHPGWRGRGAGPDFRHALIAPPSGAPLRGDVELHVRASDFRAHGHQGDRRYDRLVLHVVFEDDADEETALACGRRVPVVALAPWLRRRARELEGWLARPGLWREPCVDALARLGRDRVLGVLGELGDARFAERAAALAEALRSRGPAEALYGALLEGLGYGGERERLAALAGTLPWAALAARLEEALEGERVLTAEALLLGAAGLLPPRPDHAYEVQLADRWRAAGLPGVGGASLALAARPANHPARRLAGLARLAVRNWHLFEGGALLLAEQPPARLVETWTVPAVGYWSERLSPGVAAKRPAGALIGRSRAIELLVNAVLPWAAALADVNGDQSLAVWARTCFAALPRPARYGALAFLEQNLRTDERPLPLDARRQQGLLALYKTECTQGGCGRCPLS